MLKFLRHTRDIKHLAALVYFTQGAVGITSVGLPIYLRKMGWTITEIATASSIIAIPWVLKIFYGLISDCLPLAGYRRKSYLILFPLLAAVSWLILSLGGPDRSFIITMLLIANVGYAATDVITDGLIVEHSNEFTTHVYQSIAWGARSVGAILSSALGGYLTQHVEPQTLFLIAACLPLLTLTVAFQIREKKQARTPFRSVMEPLRRCAAILLTPRIRWFTLFLILMQVSSCYGVPFFFHMKESMHFNESFLGILLSVGWFGAVIGSLLYARWLSRKSLTLVIKIAVGINVINTLSTLLITGKLSALILVFLGGMMACITILPIMSTCAVVSRHSGVEGTLFAILASIYNIGQIIFSYIGGRVHNMTGIPMLIILAASVNFLIFFMVNRMNLDPPAEPQPA
ncbi:MAG: MFS transporter [Candidatus Omnitrophica bacterium]|nr:MFS transporter [Candidatus Omnitrophota bacterium]